MRLIDADTLLETGSGIKMIIPKNCHPYEAIKIQGKAFRNAVEEAPTIDAAPVVRCKDCKHWHPDDDEGHCDNPDGLDNYAKPDDFCSYGERKDNG